MTEHTPYDPRVEDALTPVVDVAEHVARVAQQHTQRESSTLDVIEDGEWRTIYTESSLQIDTDAIVEDLEFDYADDPIVEMSERSTGVYVSVEHASAGADITIDQERPKVLIWYDGSVGQEIVSRSSLLDATDLTGIPREHAERVASRNVQLLDFEEFSAEEAGEADD